MKKNNIRLNESELATIVKEAALKAINELDVPSPVYNDNKKEDDELFFRAYSFYDELRKRIESSKEANNDWRVADFLNNHLNKWLRDNFDHYFFLKNKGFKVPEK